jgi:hypothetical protein
MRYLHGYVPVAAASVSEPGSIYGSVYNTVAFIVFPTTGSQLQRRSLIHSVALPPMLPIQLASLAQPSRILDVHGGVANEMGEMNMMDLTALRCGGDTCIRLRCAGSH